MNIKTIKTKIFKEGENLADFVKSNIRKVPENTVIVVTSKIVALAESRTRIVTSIEDKEKIIKARNKITVKNERIYLCKNFNCFFLLFFYNL